MIHGQARQILYFLVKTGNNQGKEELYMAEIIHRYVNGTEISFHDLPIYQITNQTILDIICNASRRSRNGNDSKQNISTLQ